MENINEYPENEELKNKDHSDNDEELEFENPSVDPGFETTDEPEDENEFPEDEEQQPVDDNAKGNDALNYNNDRENGAYNPKNI